VAQPKDDELEEIDQKDDGYIELVLRVLARMCDGQHKGLQVLSSYSYLPVSCINFEVIAAGIK